MFLIVAAIGVVVLVILLIFGVQGPPYVPSDDKTSKQLLKLVDGYKPNRILDMGSGDGKLVILLASAGYEAVGIELNPLLVIRSRREIKRLGLQSKATILWGSFWRCDVSSYDLVTLYVIKHIMPRLEQKLTKELPADAHIISNFFEFPNTKPIKQVGRLHVYKV